MGTGIVSVALAWDNQEIPSDSLLALGGLLWLGLVLAMLRHARRRPARLSAQARSPAALTVIAGTSVIGAGFVQIGWPVPAEVLLALGVLGWIGLTPVVARGLPVQAGGEWFMLVVATESVAALAAAVALSARADWLALGALALAVIGLLFYPAVLARFDLREAARGRGDHWVAGGSVAISALAFAEISEADRGLSDLHALTHTLGHVALALWVGGMAWLGVLLIAECVWPRPRYDFHRWATVFPLGMYAACSFKVSLAAGIPLAADFAHGWVWVSVAGWLATAAGALAHARSE